MEKINMLGKLQKIIYYGKMRVITFLERFNMADNKLKDKIIKHEKSEIKERKKMDKDDKKLIKEASMSKKKTSMSMDDDMSMSKKCTSMSSKKKEDCSISAKKKSHPGFKAVEKKIERKEGVSKKAAGAILANSSRNASSKAKASNPKLNKVK
jgi:ribosomal protein L31